MPALGWATVGVAALVALALVVAVTIILMQLTRTSRVLGDIDGLLAAMPAGLTPLGPTIGRINRAVGRLLEK